jgi:hypothetical protein
MSFYLRIIVYDGLLTSNLSLVFTVYIQKVFCYLEYIEKFNFLPMLADYGLSPDLPKIASTCQKYLHVVIFRNLVI